MRCNECGENDNHLPNCKTGVILSLKLKKEKLQDRVKKLEDYIKSNGRIQ